MNLILEAGGDADRLLSYAALEGRANMVDLLIKAGADVNSSKALFSAIESESSMSLKLLLDAGLKVNNKFGSEALIRTVKSGSIECVNMLIEAGADVNARGEKESPLYYAVRNWNYNCTEVLIKAGAEIDEASLKCAVERGERFVQLMINSAGDLVRFWLCPTVVALGVP